MLENQTMLKVKFYSSGEAIITIEDKKCNYKGDICLEKEEVEELRKILTKRFKK